MARFDRLTVLNRMLEVGVVPVFYNGSLEKAIKIVEACAKGGITVAEFTNRGDQAMEVFKELVNHFGKTNPDIILGVGSIVDAPTAAIAIAYGTNFVVGPMLNAEVARVCNRRKIPYMPGTGSASEISAAEELGCEIVKVFPGTQVGGPAFIKAVTAPMPWSRLMPTGGVSATEDNIKGWISNGAACVGIGSSLVRKDWVAAGDYDKITETGAKVIQWIKEARNR
ncbi:MAG: bifunctional 4-hydroxy-2-oxoglutarate aldolase/2-dehydro-3-deoxy-phosphogluconate aldolase [Anaerolineae bacterium]|nr:bifunctional 4-hydroxy-2-oxoglutarate aldolase/2-dehydro-3-deoxy-phosphogluconate aldolase [Anaerolineae bacterium]